MLYRLIPVFFLLTIHLNAQKNLQYECGSNPTELEQMTIQEMLHSIDDQQVILPRSVTSIPMRVWIITDSTGLNSVSESAIQTAIGEANTTFAEANLEFFICQPTEQYVHHSLSNFKPLNESQLKQLFYSPGVINFYIFNSLEANSGTPLCGYAKFPGGTDMVFMDKNCLNDGSTLVHELGHFFGLYHTHGNAPQTNELVNGSNCTIAGDDVCDTPADPNLKSLVDSDCIYVANIMDNNGEPYQPDPTNVMSYAPAPCRYQFSEGQIERIKYVHYFLRNYLSCDLVSTEFEVNYPEAICDTATLVNFNYIGNASNAYITWDIDNDGIEDYTGLSVEHQFTEPGDYDVVMYLQEDTLELSRLAHSAVQVFERHQLPRIFDLDEASTIPQHKLLNPDHNNTWFRTRLHPTTPKFAFTIDNYHNYLRGEIDAFILGPIELNGTTQSFLTFDVAYSDHGPGYADRLRVLISQDCGETFEEVYSKSGSDLATVQYQSSSQWMPVDGSEWRNEYIDLTAYLGQEVLIKFENINDFGNNLYVDQITIDGDEPLAHETISFSGRTYGEGRNRLKWKIDDLDNVEYAWLEASLSNESFQSVHQILREEMAESTFDHHFAAGTDLYYRIVVAERDDVLRISHVVYIPSMSDDMLKVFPNPTQGSATLSLTDQQNLPASYHYEIVSASGLRAVQAAGVLNNPFEHIQLDVRHLPAGAYWIQFEINDQMYQQRLIKTE